MKIFNILDKNMLDIELICGVDEAGRGPLVGDVYAAAVILDPARPICGLKDSKQLSAGKRESLYNEIVNKALAYGIASSTVAEIDSLNILKATLIAMQRAVAKLAIMPTLVLIDGNHAPQLEIATRTIIKGDTLEPAISAASILAKVTRDRTMIALDQQYPQYGFAKHKGYGTAEHLRAIEQFGVLPTYHRHSFALIKSYSR